MQIDLLRGLESIELTDEERHQIDARLTTQGWFKEMEERKHLHFDITEPSLNVPFKYGGELCGRE